jgi:effector-binding domain-containing protein
MTVTEPPADEPALVTVAPATTAVVRGTVSTDELRDFFDQSFAVLGAALTNQRISATGAAFSRYQGEDDEEPIDLEVGFPTDRPIDADGSAEASELPGGRVARLVHSGSFDGLSDAWQRLADWIGAADLTPSDDRWEVYLTEPSPEMDPSELRTELNWSIR